ncbi:hypothetical protein [Streptomyces sp. NPDC051636]|uniref:hypothetical protein n=1 Tax=Streptomyces sp. NPDC051636 TaxID=3365663 RepID=UPI0037ABDD05
MVMPGGSQLAFRNEAFSRESQSTLESQQSTEPIEDGGDQLSDGYLVHRSQSDIDHRATTQSGVWLETQDGMLIFHPVSAGPLSERPNKDGDDRHMVLDAEEKATLEAASWLMPKLPRELIAQYLSLGPYRQSKG